MYLADQDEGEAQGGEGVPLVAVEALQLVSVVVKKLICDEPDEDLAQANEQVVLVEDVALVAETQLQPLLRDGVPVDVLAAVILF